MSDVLELGKTRAEEIGLRKIIPGCGYEHEAYLAEDIHRLLGEGVGAYAAPVEDEGLDRNYWGTNHGATDDIKALLIAIRPIAKPDTAESLLKEIVACEGVPPYPTIERAKAFLDKGEK